jgi:hypothetical protein
VLEWFPSDAILLHPPSQIALAALNSAAALDAEAGAVDLAPLLDVLCDSDASKQARLEESIQRVQASADIGSALPTPDLLTNLM